MKMDWENEAWSRRKRCMRGPFQPVSICLIVFFWASVIVDGVSGSAAWAQETPPAGQSNPETSGTGGIEPLAPNDQPIELDADNVAPPNTQARKRSSNGLRKTLLKQGAAEEPQGEGVQDASNPNEPITEILPEENTSVADAATKKPGKANKPMIRTDPIGLFLAGGHLMPVILLASVVTLWFGLERMFVLRRGRVIPHAFVKRFLQHLDEGKLNPETALRLCEENQSPIADVFAHGVRKWGKTSVEIEQAIIDGGERQVALLRTNMRVINGMANISPMLGLLGTVFGMIISFNELAQGSDANRSERLANGIGHALITTAAGLAVAIFSIVLYMYLSGKIDRLVIEMDELGQKVVNLISGESLASRPRTSVAKSPAPAAATAPVAPTPLGKPKPVGT